MTTPLQGPVRLEPVSLWSKFPVTAARKPSSVTSPTLSSQIPATPSGGSSAASGRPSPVVVWRQATAPLRLVFVVLVVLDHDVHAVPAVLTQVCHYVAGGEVLVG